MIRKMKSCLNGNKYERASSHFKNLVLESIFGNVFITILKSLKSDRLLMTVFLCWRFG